MLKDRRKKNRRRPRPQQSATKKVDLDYDNLGSSAVSTTVATGTTAPDVGGSDLVSRYVRSEGCSTGKQTPSKFRVSCIYGSSQNYLKAM